MEITWEKRCKVQHLSYRLKEDLKKNAYALQVCIDFSSKIHFLRRNDHMNAFYSASKSYHAYPHMSHYESAEAMRKKHVLDYILLLIAFGVKSSYRARVKTFDE